VSAIIYGMSAVLKCFCKVSEVVSFLHLFIY